MPVILLTALKHWAGKLAHGETFAAAAHLVAGNAWLLSPHENKMGDRCLCSIFFILAVRLS